MSTFITPTPAATPASDTPRTDRVEINAYTAGIPPRGFYVTASFARQLERDLAAARSRIAELESGLQRIERWHGEFPETGRFWDEPHNTQPMSYAACFGSNGERDYMREIARQLLTPPTGGPR